MSMMRASGSNVDSRRNAPSALRLLSTFDPDALIIDILLPVFDGNLIGEEAARPAEGGGDVEPAGAGPAGELRRHLQEAVRGRGPAGGSRPEVAQAARA